MIDSTFPKISFWILTEKNIDLIQILQQIDILVDAVKCEKIKTNNINQMMIMSKNTSSSNKLLN